MVGKARKRGVAQRRPARTQKEEKEEEEEEEQGPPPSPGDPSYFQDQVDAFHEARSQAALAASWSDGESGAEDPEEEEEVLGLDVAEEEDEEDEDDADSVGGSSALSEADDADADPSLSWGRRKNLYYDTDYRAAKGRGRQSQQEAEQEEREEEEEAQLIQRRLAQALHEDDFGLSWVQAFGEASQAQPRAEEARTRVVADPQRLPAKEKLKLLRRESPELLELIEDLKAKLRELRDELEPLLRLTEAGVVPPGKGSRYLRTKYSLYLHYCSNICFYLVLKARRAPVHGHPVIERLVTYRNLINRLALVDRRLSGEVRRLLSPGAAASRGTADPKRRPKPKLPSKVPAVSAAPGPEDDSDVDEEAARKQYREVEERVKLKRKKEEAAEGREGEAPEEPNAKRAITYQIAKNKGLTPRRKKVDRNPRVKHREKFRRAKIRRRGQVRPVRTEEYRYAGELSGIRAGVKKSVKLK
ncbi:LOW QUALITY PROTEIN: something about silencing protein 10 [Phascolarctos cinereus]|uniref:LOW QUALITY PROTEIN: something about silencing protein 10 n=1 Tax=Phascolarctos cinereus TaxID=38626 RepID=A0A6P5KI70_PHACI|nr:LOW QUALITY PROTEIN: something about silencing protein 10 [Phascolarctos cinereus]